MTFFFAKSTESKRPVVLVAGYNNMSELGIMLWKLIKLIPM